MLHAKLGLEALHIRHVRPPEGIDALVIVADGKHTGLGRAELLEPLILQGVGVLKLINQHMGKPLSIVIPQGGVAREQLHTAQEQLPKIHHTLALTLLVIGLIDRHKLLVVAIAVINGRGTQALLLGAVDKRLHLTRRVFFIVHTHGLHEPLDRCQLVLRVQNLKSRGQGRLAMVGPQQAVTETMKSADPHTLEVDRQHGAQPGQHLPGRLVGKGDRQQAIGADLTGGNQPGNAGGQDPGLAAAGPRQNQGGLFGKGDSGLLRWV